MSRNPRVKVWWMIGIAGLSGCAGLGYEIVWARLLTASLGHEMVAVLGVVAAVFGGLALGSLAFGRRIVESAHPARWYAGLELTIGLWALVLIALFPAINSWVPWLVPIDASPARHWLVVFGLPLVVLLPATSAMGGTLPALEAMLAPLVSRQAAVGRVYAANTFGAVAGTLATTFALLPQFGLAVTLMICAAVNLVCAIGILRWDEPAGAVTRAPGAPAVRSFGALAPLFLTGLLGIGYEVVAIRVVSQILENTVYTFAVLLAVYLFGTALGSALWSRRAAREGGRSTWLAIATALACLAGTLALANAKPILWALQAITPASMGGRLFAEFGVALAAFLVPTIAMGALFADLAQAARDRDGSLGAALSLNTLGAALAPILFGPIAIPWLGPELTLTVVALLYLTIVPTRRGLGWAVPVAIVAVAAGLTLSLRFVQTGVGGAVVWHRDGVMAAVSVIRDSAGENHLQVNNHFRMGGTASVRSDHRQAHIPLLLHPSPHRALFLGLGTGATLSAAVEHPALEVDGVELVPEVVESFPLFARAASQPGPGSRVRIHVADARRFAKAATAPYDVIVADLYHPSLDGSGALYSREHFAAIRSALAPDGVFCQWLPLHQLDLATLRVIVRTFQSEFPESRAFLAQFSVETPLIALIGGGPRDYADGWLDRRVSDRAMRTRLAELDLKSDVALFGLSIAGAEGLRRFAGEGGLNTDDRPLVTFDAARAAYASENSPGERLVALLDALSPDARLLRDPGAADGELSRRLMAYWRARNRFIEIGARKLVRPDAGDFVTDVAPRLIEVVQQSADFDAAYLPVLAMARQLAKRNPVAARTLLEQLDRANPLRPEARRLLAVLPSS